MQHPFRKKIEESQKNVTDKNLTHFWEQANPNVTSYTEAKKP